MKLELKIQIPNEREQTFRISGDECIAGRTDGHLILASQHCSRAHFRLFCRPNGDLVLTDLKSKNGTLLNGKKIQETTVSVGDTIQAGDIVVVVSSYSSQIAPADKKPMKGTSTEATKSQIRQVKREELEKIDPNIVVHHWPDNYTALPDQLQDKFVAHVDDEPNTSEHKAPTPKKKKTG